MDEQEFIFQLQLVVNSQRSILGDLSDALNGLETSVSNALGASKEITDLQEMMAAVEGGMDFLDVEDLRDWDNDEATLKKIYEKRSDRFSKGIQSLQFINWQQFVRDSKVCCTQNGMDALLPWESMLSEKSIADLHSGAADSRCRWDRWDYAFVGTAGVAASLVDYLLVGIPKAMTYGDVKREGSPITAFLKKKINSKNGSDTWFAEWVRTLEGLCKVPYDRVGNSGIAGISGQTHRLQTLGHDPILGMVFGVLDILKGTITAFSYDHLSGKHSFNVGILDEETSSNLIEIVLRQLGHLISDVGTEKGIPAPLFTLFQGINIPSPFSPKGRTIGEISRWMYTQGYDLRHFITMGITPAVIEIILRAYIMLRQYSETGDVKFLLADDPKYRCMLLTAHAIACAGNAGKIALMQGNPLAINYAEWLALVRYLAPSLKYWIFDRASMHLAHIQKVNEAGWDELCRTTDKLITEVCGRSYSTIELR